MNIEIRECGNKDCIEYGKIYYHIFKDGTQHLVMMCPIHRYVGLPMEYNLNIPFYNKNDVSIETVKMHALRIKKESRKRQMTARQLLSL